MTRTIEDQVYVRVQQLDEPDEPVEASPTQFIWRGRLYVVQAVLGHWRERQSWWPGYAQGPVDAGAAATVADLAAAGDREIWRVHAAVGRRAAGVFELCAEGAGERRQWRLLRVED